MFSPCFHAAQKYIQRPPPNPSGGGLSTAQPSPASHLSFKLRALAEDHDACGRFPYGVWSISCFQCILLFPSQSLQPNQLYYPSAGQTHIENKPYYLISNSLFTTHH